ELHDNKISTIDAQVFYKIPELCHLDLRGNKLKVITTLGYTPVFADLPELKALVLTGQDPKTEAVMYNAFRRLPKLEHLWLDKNDLQHFPNPAFSQEEWPSIKELHIESNKLTTFSSYSKTDFPPDMHVLWASKKDANKPFAQMKSLQKLMVHDNKIDKVEEEDLWELNNLKELYLSSNLLTENTIHPEAFRNTSVTKLLLRRNSIVAVETGAFPTSILKIDLDNNQFDFRHSDVFANLPSLTYLSLISNEIKFLPGDAFNGLINLKTFDFSSNHLTLLPAQGDFDGLSIRSFGFSNGAQTNPLKNIASRAFNNVRGRYIILSSLELTTIRSETFKNVVLSEDLRLDGNPIESIEVHAFDDLEAQYLDLRGNEIKSLSGDSFVGLTVVNDLFLLDNELVIFPHEALKILNPKSLDLRNNKILSLPNNSLDTFTNLLTLNLENNKLTELKKDIFQKLTKLINL
ncbi:leucine-rich repeat-containing G- coupled receptor 4-like, partial [Paramuricea clavata]